MKQQEPNASHLNHNTTSLTTSHHEGVGMLSGNPARAAVLQVERPALTIDKRASHCLYTPPPRCGVVEGVRLRARGWCRCRGGGVWSWVKRRVPILEWLPRYDLRAALLGDLIGGFTVGIMHIPQGMAYALLAGLPPITGLYMAFFPVLVYVVLGTSRHVSMGTFAVACLMMGKVVGELANTDTDTNTNITTTTPSPLYTLTIDSEAVAPSPNTVFTSTTLQYTPQQVAAVLALVVGLWEIGLGLVQMGEVFSVVLSDMLISGFTTGVAVQVLTSQVKYLLGIPIPRISGPFKVIYTYVEIIERLLSANPAAVVMSAVCIVILVFNNEVIKPRVKRYTRLPVPIELMVVALGTLVSYLANLEQSYQITVVGHIPTGLLEPSPPLVELAGRVALDAFIIGVVGYTSTFSMAKIFAKRQGYTVHATQELYAQGVSNVFGSFFSCGPMAASLSRSLIQEAVGSVTLLTALFSCMVILLVLLFIGPLFETLPNCVLSSIIVVALKGLFLQVKDFKTLWSCSRLDAFIWLITFLTSVIVDIDYGLVVGVLVSLVVLVVRSQTPSTARLGHIPHTDLYLDINKHHKAVELPGLRIFQFSGSIHFANASYFRSKLLSVCELDLSPFRLSRHQHTAATKKAFLNKSPSKTFLSIKSSSMISKSPEIEISEASEEVADGTFTKLWSGTRITSKSKPTHLALTGVPDNVQKSRMPTVNNEMTSHVHVTTEEEGLCGGVEWVVVEVSGVGFVDTMACRLLTQLYHDLQAVGITLCLAAPSERVLCSLDRCGSLEVFSADHIFHSVHDAVALLLSHPSLPPSPSLSLSRFSNDSPSTPDTY